MVTVSLNFFCDRSISREAERERERKRERIERYKGGESDEREREREGEILCDTHMSCKFWLFQRVYFGASCDVSTHFSSLGFTCDPQYNPADFVSA